MIPCRTRSSFATTIWNTFFFEKLRLLYPLVTSAYARFPTSIRSPPTMESFFEYLITSFMLFVIWSIVASAAYLLPFLASHSSTTLLLLALMWAMLSAFLAISVSAYILCNDMENHKRKSKLIRGLNSFYWLFVTILLLLVYHSHARQHPTFDGWLAILVTLLCVLFVSTACYWTVYVLSYLFSFSL